MDATYYNAIFKRKSFHLFRNVGKEMISEEELAGIEAAYTSFEALYPEIRTAIRIVPAKQVKVKRDADYCILIYSEKKKNYLMNAGYLGEQLDLYLVAHDIGTLWYGMGKPDEAYYDGLDYVIMIAIRKISDQTKYRKDMFKSKRKPLEETWSGETLGVAEIARFAPSACNSQPWLVQHEGNQLTVSRYRKPGRVGIMPAALVPYYNRIDMGIYLCILEICMAHEGVSFTRELFVDPGEKDAEYTKVAVYTI